VCPWNFFYMKSWSLLGIGITLITLISCDSVIQSKFLISDRENYYENERFSFYYPDNWVVILRENGVLVGDPSYRKFSIQVKVYQFEEAIESINKEQTIKGFLEYSRKLLNDAGFLQTKCHEHNPFFDKKQALDTTCFGENPNAYDEQRAILVSVDNYHALGWIWISYTENFAQPVRKRIEEMINSIHFKN